MEITQKGIRFRFDNGEVYTFPRKTAVEFTKRLMKVYIDDL